MWIFYQFKLSSIKLGSLISMVCQFDKSAIHSFPCYVLLTGSFRLIRWSLSPHFFSHPLFHFRYSDFFNFFPSANCGICLLHVTYKFFGWVRNYKKIFSSNVLCLSSLRFVQSAYIIVPHNVNRSNRCQMLTNSSWILTRL